MNGAFLPPDQGTIDQLQQMGGQMQAPEGGGVAAGEPAAPPEDPGAGAAAPQQGDGQYDHLDLEGCISSAIESGCHLAEAAVSAEDYERFAHGVNLLCIGLSKIQPATDPAEASLAAAQIAADQRDRQAQAAASRPAGGAA